MPNSFLYIFPAAFPALALAHFLALLSPGPDFFLILGQAARHRFRGSALICPGIAAGNAIYIALAVLGWSGLKESPALYRAVELAGAAYLLWLAFRLWQSAGKGAAELSPNRAEARALGPWAQFSAGLASALLNPKNAVFYLALMTVITGPGASLGQQAAAGVWMTLLVLGWDLLLAALIAHPAVQERIRRRIPLVERLAALVLAGISLSLLLAPVLARLGG